MVTLSVCLVTEGLMVGSESGTVPLALAAQRLRLSWQQAWRLLLRGELDGVKRAGRWHVWNESLDAAEQRRASREHSLTA